MVRKIFTILVLAVLVTAVAGFAGITGKIAGRIIDAENSEVIAGVNVMIEGMTIGAVSDVNGNFVILNVPPGTYTLKASMIGYAPATVKNVVVKMDQTTTIDFKLKAEALTMGEVVVVAQRPVVTRDVSASEMHVEAKTIESLPVNSVREVLALQAGIERTSDGVRIRGGGANQTAFMVDGLSLNDERSNLPYTVLSLNSIKEIKVQTGGFNAEYGNVRSGIIDVVTREGDRTTYNAGITLQYRPPAKKHFGPSIYDPYTYFTRPYMDDAVCWTGTNNGAWDAHTRRQYPSFEGWNAVSAATLQDNDPRNDLTPAGAKRLWEWQHRRQGDITRPDYVLDIGFGGPVPLVSRRLLDARFFFSHFRNREMFIYPLSRDDYQENVSQLKISTDLTPRMKLNLTGLYGEIHSVSPYDWTTTPTGYVLRTNEEIADLVNSSSGNSILYMPGYYSPSSIYRTMFGATFTHMLSARTFYEVNLQHNINRYNTFKLADRDTSKKYEPVSGIFVDEAPYGYWGYGVTGIDGMSMGGWMNLGRDKSVIATTKFKADFTSQLDNVNEVKAGVDVVYNDYDIKSSTESPSMRTWTRSQIYRRFPYRIGAYLQDKLEFKGFIANLGLRYDYSNSNGTYYVLDPYSKYFAEGFGKVIEVQVPTEEAKPVSYWSPRLGISHPITVNSKLYFNYGHFTQEPASTYRFRLQREANGLVTSIGDPNLGFERTIAYELGYAHSLFDEYLLNIAAYYKDVTGQPGWIYYENFKVSVQYQKPANNNYEDIRGFEITLSKSAGAWLAGFINYTYEVRTYGYFGLRSYYEDPNKQRDYLRLNPYQERPHPLPYARANLVFRTPQDFGPRWLGQHLLGGMDLSVLASWKAGAYATFNPNNLPGVVDNVRWKDRYNIDLRLSKLVRINRYDVQFYLDVTNALNTKYLSFAGFSNTFDYNDYLESLHFSWEEGAEHGNDKIGDYRKEGVAYERYDPNDPTKTPEDLKRILETKAYIDMPNLTYFTFLNPRDIRFGLKIDF
ncbi:MAG: TonB-dependent receptor [candidate division KSB1 bacterium]|nr:TonB-dependent receptor [candidate division KSB1 bacterium]MDZ7310367.1 TonB-dependent receptor [candidate division KSB1 bacterium]